MTIAVPALDNDGDDTTNPVAFDTISRMNIDDDMPVGIRTALAGFMQRIASGERVEAMFPAIGSTSMYGIWFDSVGASFIELTEDDANNSFNHAGRVYAGTSNIASYQIVADTDTAFQNYDGTDFSDLGSLTVANDAQMGLLALINGRRNLEGISTFADLKIATHGIAPEARLRVFSSFRATSSRFNGS